MKTLATEQAYRDEYGDELVTRARSRTVTETRFGMRVAYDQDLDGDYEFEISDGEPRAYWPTQGSGSWWCRCRHGRTKRPCSHVLAVLLRGVPVRHAEWGDQVCADCSTTASAVWLAMEPGFDDRPYWLCARCWTV